MISIQSDSDEQDVVNTDLSIKIDDQDHILAPTFRKTIELKLPQNVGIKPSESPKFAQKETIMES
jgi:hypothetical protein